MVSERVSVAFRVRTGADKVALPHLEARAAARLVAEVAGAPLCEPARRWVVEVEVDLEGVHLDPEYWLRHCRGFLVESEAGEDLGVVDDVELATDSGLAVALVVASGWFGRYTRLIDVADVQAIVPSQRRLVVRDTTRTAGERGQD
jgi:sporulation protein YlmC with PRC-barrel domain